MKPILNSTCSLAFLCLALSLSVHSQTHQSPLFSGNQKNVSGAPPVSDSWFQHAAKELQQREYLIHAIGKNEYGAVNRSNQLGFRFSPQGYQLKRFDFANEMKETWSIDFNVNGIGRQGQVSLSAKKVRQELDDHDLFFHYRGFSVHYSNTLPGMRQNFIVNKRPVGTGNLEVHLSFQSSLIPVPVNTKGVHFYSPANSQTPVLMYDDLVAWDARKKPLPAHMELRPGNQLVLVVDDKNAVYPVTVDPLNHAPDWTDSGNGLVFPLLDDLASPLLYGYSVSGAGDVNGDGADDIIIGAPAYVDVISISGGTFNLVSVGAAFVYYGSGGGPSTTPSEVLQGTSVVGALFGFSVSTAGDINGDGFDDVAIGAPGDRVSLTIAGLPVSAAVGSVYIYYGSSFDGNVNTEPVVSVNVHLTQPDFGLLPALPVNPLYGFSVSNAGDVNGDGYGDIVVGSPAYLNLTGLTIGGRVDVFHGSLAGLVTTPARTITGGLVGGLFGFSVSNAGRVNSDGFDDIIVGAPASISLLALGSAYIFHGSGAGITATSTAGANSTLQAPGLLNRTLFGYSVSNAGDVNGDGLGDVIIGEPLSLEQTLSLQLVAVGKAHIFYGSNTGVVTAGRTELTSPRRPNLLGLVQGNLLYGFSVSAVGDVNCDGLSDVIVGEPGGTAISLGTGVLGLVSANALSGRAYVYYGKNSSGPLNSPSWQVQETAALSAANLLGASVSFAGDVNADGSADLLIGAPNGTLNFNGSLISIIGNALGIITSNSIGSAYSHFGCLANADLDFDNDGVPDAIDLDDDNDGIPDNAEYPGLGLTEDPAADHDGDGIPNYSDADFSACGGLNANDVCTNFDKDGDGIPNSFDLDSDNDGVPDVIEAGGVDADGDGVLDDFTDTDNDGLSQSVDANNTGAAGSGNGLDAPDFDGDGIPNSLDIDSDGDGVTDLRETGQPDADNDGRVDGFTDADGDGFTDSLDPRIGHSGPADPAGTGTPAIVTPADGNNDGRYDGNPTTVNQDGDALFNFIDLDSDNDGITDNVEAQSTAGYVLPATGDSDNDGLANIYDSQGGIYTAGGIIPNNHDGTDNPDYLDTDTDNDGRIDRIEGHDLNLNGQPDDDVSLTGLDADGDGIDDRFDLVAGPNVTTGGMGNPPVPGSSGPLQNTFGAADRDWRNALYVLPVSLVQFTAAYTGSSVRLQWITASEENSDYFDIERSADGTRFETIGNKPAAGTTTSRQYYNYEDASPLTGYSYYRLKQVDLDGRFTYSTIVRVTAQAGARGISIYPNPADHYFQLTWTNMKQGNYILSIIGSDGQMVKRHTVAVNGVFQVTTIQRETSWSPGIYLLQVSAQSGEVVSRLQVVVR